jgi:DNA polymerase-3 subunit alpha (Gram-positive type)
MKNQNGTRQRVELHAHTKMTETFGICSAKELIERAAQYGHSAVAITDNGSVQAFPDAETYGKENGIKIIYGWEADVPDSRFDETPSEFTALVRNQQGLKNLYKLVTQSFISKRNGIPLVSKADIEKHREGLLLGSGIGGEVFGEMLYKRPWNELCETAKFYDYLEIYPNGILRFLVENGKLKDEEDIEDFNRTVVKLGEELNIPVVATENACYLDPADSICHSIMMYAGGFDDKGKQPPQYFMTTEEMLGEFSYLGEKKAYKVVVENTNLIADMIDNVRIKPREEIRPVIDGANEIFKKKVWEKAYLLYGTSLPKIISTRIEDELAKIFGNGYTVHYEIARRLVEDSEKHGYHVGSRGSVGSSLVAYLAGITEVNPLPPHYICPKCRHIEFVEGVGSGYDLPDKICPDCNEKMKGEGHNIPFETFAGFQGDKEPDIDLNFAPEYHKNAQDHLSEILGNKRTVFAGTIGRIWDNTAYGNVKKYEAGHKLNFDDETVERLVKKLCGIKRITGGHPGGVIAVPKDFDIEEITPLELLDDGRTVTHICYMDLYGTNDLYGSLLKIDLLGHTVPEMYRFLERETGKRISEIPMNDSEVCSLFTSPDALGVTGKDIFCETGTLALPEVGTPFARKLLMTCKPECFSDLVKISGLSHGTDVWTGNAENLITSGTADLKSVIAARDDIFNYLTQKGFDRESAFSLMEFVRKGKGSRLKDVGESDLGEMREKGVPEWYIESMQKIRYLFPKAHATAYMIAAVRLGWYKLNYPAEFYTAYFDSRFDNSRGISTALQGKDAVRERLTELLNKGKELYRFEEDELEELLVFNEAMQRGVEILPPEVPFSDDEDFTVIENTIYTPLKYSRNN